MHGTRTAIVFPGQGSRSGGMRETVEETRPDLLELAVRAVGADPFARLGQGTRFDQPAIFCAGLAGFERLGRPKPDYFAGHSLGELTALVAAGALSEADGLVLVAERGRLMDAASRSAAGGMLALRASYSEANALADRTGLALANDNAPDQVVLSGSEPNLVAAQSAARELGLKAKRLAVAGAFHSPAMAAVVEPFRAVLEQIEFRRPEVPVMSCVTAEPFTDPERVLADALVSPVRWLEVMRRLHADGVRRFVEPGPGRVLTGLVRRSLERVEAIGPEALEPARA